MSFNIGDIVILKSEGPEMTIYEYPLKMLDGTDNHSIAKCKWFDENNQLKSGDFPVEILNKR